LIEYIGPNRTIREQINERCLKNNIQKLRMVLFLQIMQNIHHFNENNEFDLSVALCNICITEKNGFKD